MTTALDTNIITALSDTDDSLNAAALALLDIAHERGKIVICAAVYAELLAAPKNTEAFLDNFLVDTRIAVDWNSGEAIWRLAGQAFKKYSAQRRRKASPGLRRILADFFIGAHALDQGHALLTLDTGIYRQAFPKLRIIKL